MSARPLPTNQDGKCNSFAPRLLPVECQQYPAIYCPVFGESKGNLMYCAGGLCAAFRAVNATHGICKLIDKEAT
jgi:hypothetical protein